MRKRRTKLLWIPTVISVALGALFLSAYRPDIPLADLRNKYANAASQFMTIQGMPVHYRDEGSGTTLVLLHGTGASLHTWDGWISPLEHDFRIVRLDLPGFGLTGPAPDDDYTIRRYVGFLREFTQRLELDQFHLAGNSLGGRIAWNYALEHADDVDRLVLIDAAGYPREQTLDSSMIFKIARTPGINWLFTVMTPRSMTERSLREVYGDPDKVTEDIIDRYFELSLRPGNRRAFVERVLDADADSDGDHRKISQPTLILWGVEDRWIPLADARGFADDIEGSRLRVFPGVGHIPMEELPGQSARAALTFLRDQPARTGRAN
jgi:pimeloyl-ACP methyl ester carboxylesterase